MRLCMEAEVGLPREADTGAEGSVFSLYGIASRESLFQVFVLYD